MNKPAPPARLRIVRSSAPDTAAPEWETIYRDHVVGVYRFVHARCGNRPDAEDLTADIFLRALPRLRTAASSGEIHGYLIATARTVLADFWARSYAVPAGGLDDRAAPASTFDVDADDPDDGRRQTAARAEELLGRLSESHRAVLDLRFLRGYSIKETAAALGISTANAKVIQWRALRRAAALDERAGP
jgi:RNA polymerase sigma-70 factor (ECF subfamily)